MGDVVDDIIGEPYRGSIGDPRTLQQAGLETLRGYARGALPGPPFSRLTGTRPTEAGLGKATFTMPVTRWLEDGFGLYWGGIYALFADAPLGCAIWTTLPAGKLVTTSELNLSFVRPMSRKTVNMIGRAETVHSGNQVGLSMIQITDQDGRLLAFGSTRCLIVDAPPAGGAGAAPRDAEPAATPDPYLRPPPEGGYFTYDQVMNGVPIELQRRTIAGDPIFPVWRLTGYRPTAIDDGRCNAILPGSRWFSNGGPSIYGGLLAWAAEFTMGAAVYSSLGRGDVFATLDMHIRFTRPALIDAGDLSLEAVVNHRGKRLRVTSCNVNDREGRRVAMATSSALVVEGGVREVLKGRAPEDILSETSE